ncbi:MAG: hypothetical protein DME01_03070 [Candidatus Rokuibacteriota bacterium]|nr:MAG: hypothetical protein DME01_03070 [Candidatus Rokubacteria bacterium]
MRRRVYCTGMVARVAMVGLLSTTLVLSAASAQEARSGEAPAPLELKREAKPARPIARPESDRGQASRDAARAAAEYEQRQRDDQLVREQTRPALRRPDLGYEVTGGIQQRNLRR